MLTWCCCQVPNEKKALRLAARIMYWSVKRKPASEQHSFVDGQVMCWCIIGFCFAANDVSKFDELVVVTAGHWRQSNFLVALLVFAARPRKGQLQAWRLERADIYGALVAANDELTLQIVSSNS